MGLLSADAFGIPRPDPTDAAATGVTAGAVDRVRRLAAAELPPEVVVTARACVLDWFGTALAGAPDAAVDAVAADLAPAVDAPCTLIARRARVGPADAALVNGVAGDVLDFSDTHRALHGHATATVLPAVLALAEARAADGATVVRALIAGVEMAARAGLLLGDGVLMLPVHPTAGAGTLGAAAAGAAVLGLNPERWIAALGIAATQAAGLADAMGTACKPLHAGLAAANGVRAALLAARGFTASAAALEPDGAFVRTHTSRAQPAALDAAGDRYLIGETLLKAYAACQLTHGCIDAVRHLQREHDVRAGDIAAMDFTIAQSSVAICDIVAPRTATEARFSLRTVAAMALLEYDLGAPDTYGAAATAADVAALRARCTVSGDPELPVAVSRARITLTDGRTFTAESDERTGISAAERMHRAERKFARLAGAAIGDAAATALASRIGILEQLPRAGELLLLTVPER